MFRNFKVILAVLVVLVLAGGAYAFAAANTFDDKAPANSGYVGAIISGYKISNIEINQGEGDLISSFVFDVTPASDGSLAKFVQIQTEGNTGKWYNCTLTGTTVAHATCLTTDLKFTEYNSLNVLASSNNNTVEGYSKINVSPVPAP